MLIAFATNYRLLIDVAVELGIVVGGGIAANVGSYYVIEFLKNELP
jgi:hypothetical protein